MLSRCILRDTERNALHFRRPRSWRHVRPTSSRRRSPFQAHPVQGDSYWGLINIRSNTEWTILFRCPQASIELKKKLDEIRLMESRKSARLADVDTDFARLADMAGDRRRASATIEVPALHLQQQGWVHTSNTDPIQLQWNSSSKAGCHNQYRRRYIKASQSMRLASKSGLTESRGNRSSLYQEPGAN